LILDSSVVVAVIVEESGYGRVLDRVAEFPEPSIGTPTLVETGMVLTGRLGTLARSMLAAFLDEHAVTVLPFEHEHWPLALRAFTQYGKGRHPAGLNLGDCFTYATARAAAEPVLCLGDDFGQTDLEVVPL